MAERAKVFDETSRRYLARIAQIDFHPFAEDLGARVAGNRLLIPFFGRWMAVSPQGISAATPEGPGLSPDFGAWVVICNYLLIGAEGPKPGGQDRRLTAYRDFKDAAPLVNYFTSNVEKAIAGHFSGRRGELAAACRRLGGAAANLDLAYDLVFRIPALPNLPVFLLFNDRDAEFPPECRVLFERRAETLLDMESLAIAGALLAQGLMSA